MSLLCTVDLIFAIESNEMSVFTNLCWYFVSADVWLKYFQDTPQAIVKDCFLPRLTPIQRNC